MSDMPAIPADIRAAFYGTLALQVNILGDGMVNATYLVTDDVGQKTVLQKLSPIFGADLAQDYKVVTEHLTAEGWEVPTSIPAQDGAAYVTDPAGSLWRVISYIPSDAPAAEDIDLKKVGSLLARMHQSLATLDYHPLFKLPHFHETPHYMHKLEQLLPTLSPEAVELARHVLTGYKRLPVTGDEPQQLIHGDPRTGNMLFRNGEPFTLIDFDTIMRGSIWLDVGDLVRSVVEDALTASQPFRRAQLEPLATGYQSVAAPESEAEEYIHSAYIAGQLIALELASRFLIDTIEDSYFTWDPAKYDSRAEHNLARAQVQWQIFELLGETT